MNRRRLLACTLALMAPGARTAGVPKRVGYIAAGSADEYFRPGEPGERFVAAMRAHGWHEGRNVRYVWTFSRHRDDLPRLADQLVASNPDVVVAWSASRARALAERARTIPIVASVADPVALGFARTLAEPGGNVTGMTRGAREFMVKGAELLRAIDPAGLKTLISLHAPSQATAPLTEAILQPLSAAIGFRHVPVHAETVEALEAQLRPMGAGLKCALAVSPPTVAGSFTPFAEAAIRHRVASVTAIPEAVREGVLACYGLKHADEMGKMASLVDRVLRGHDPAQIPFERPDRALVSINLRTARALRADIPREWQTLANEVVQ